MWVFTETGFVSAVCHYNEKGVVVVRSRDRKSLEELARVTDEPIENSPHNDYPYRVHVTKEQFQSWLVGMVSSMDYTNFKNHVYGTRGPDFAHALSGVWSVMHDVEDDDARGSR
jgi:hypothetical protein